MTQDMSHFKWDKQTARQTLRMLLMPFVLREWTVPVGLNVAHLLNCNQTVVRSAAYESVGDTGPVRLGPPQQIVQALDSDGRVGLDDHERFVLIFTVCNCMDGTAYNQTNYRQPPWFWPARWLDFYWTLTSSLHTLICLYNQRWLGPDLTIWPLSDSDLQTALSGLYDRAQAVRADKATRRSKTKAKIENTDQQLNTLIESMKDKIYAMTDDVERKVSRNEFS